MKRFPVVTSLAFLVSFGLGLAEAQEAYKQPPADVVAILDAPPTPVGIPSPSREALLLVEYESCPPIALLARPFQGLAGVRIDPARHSSQRTRQYTGIVVQSLAKDGATRRVALPAGARVQPPVWSNDGRRIAFARDLDDGVELWIADAASGEARRIDGVQLNDVLGSLLAWERDNRHLLVGAVDASRGAAPQAPPTPIGPNVQETAGKQSQMATFQDLLATPHDEALFEYYATRRLLRVDVERGTTTPVGAPGILLDAVPSPDGSRLLVRQLHRPFSFRVPYYYFTRSVEIWSPDGRPLATVARLPVSDQVPRQGVPTGPRDVQWQMLEPATLGWVEALDGGDPRAPAEHRDRWIQLELGAALAAGPPGADELAGRARESLRLAHRLRQVAWTARRGQALLTEYDRDRRWTTTWVVELGSGQPPLKLFDLSANDAYNDPGRPVREVRPDGQEVLAQDGDWIYLAGRGATEAGDRPFVDRLNLTTSTKERLFQSAADELESFAAFGPDPSRRLLLTMRQSRHEPPNYYLVDLRAEARTRLTSFPDPAPQISGSETRLVKYRRADGVPLSGFLYLPPGYTPGTRLPLVVWAYPLEYSDADTAGQVRGSPNTFIRPMGDSPLFFLTQGYAVLYDATMPVIGDPETMNDTYVEQIVAAAEAALDTLDGMGIVDRNRALVAGHSYGAFMTANLLAHSDLFAAGIARSGAYNRSLTPFGFQAERRSYWEATDIYTRVSPFTYADKIDEPILLVHGEEDSNSGTFPIQSERLFQAIQGSGGTARLVLLPHESHGYRARESVLHVLAEMFEWADRYVKNAPQRAGASFHR